MRQLLELLELLELRQQLFHRPRTPALARGTSAGTTYGVFMQRLFFPGGFDPPTHGHIDLFQRAQRLIANTGGELMVGIGANSNKAPFLPQAVRVELCRKLLPAAITVVAYNGATLAAAQQYAATGFIRGLRANDWAWEASVATAHYANGLDTVYLGTARLEHSYRRHWSAKPGARRT